MHRDGKFKVEVDGCVEDIFYKKDKLLEAFAAKLFKEDMLVHLGGCPVGVSQCVLAHVSFCPSTR